MKRHSGCKGMKKIIKEEENDIKFMKKNLKIMKKQTKVICK